MPRELAPVHDVSELLWRLPGESEEAYDAFRHYIDAGDRNKGKRSIRAVAQWVGKHEQLLYDWSRQHDWPERARRWDNRLVAIETEERERITRERATEWENRRQQLLDQSWADSQLLRGKVLGYIKDGIPDPDDPDRKSPIRWNGPSIVAALRLVVEAGAWAVKEACGESDEDFDPLTAKPEEIRAWLSQQGALPGPGTTNSIDVTPKEDDS